MNLAFLDNYCWNSTVSTSAQQPPDRLVCLESTSFFYEVAGPLLGLIFRIEWLFRSWRSLNNPQFSADFTIFPKHGCINNSPSQNEGPIASSFRGSPCGFAVVSSTALGSPGDLFSEIRKQISTIFLSLENFIHGFGVFSFLRKKRATARKSMLLLCVISWYIKFYLVHPYDTAKSSF